MRLAFLGTPDVATPALEALISSDHEVVCVVTQPDRARGRGRTVTYSPVKQVALDHGLPVLQPPAPKAPEFAEELATFRPEALVVVAYGHILARHVLEVAPAINAHFSLLPAYRGAAPVQRALMAGEQETGISVFLLEPTVDSGPILQTQVVAIQPDENAGELLARLAPMAAPLLLAALEDLRAGRRGESQDPALASPAPKIKAEEQLIDFALPAARISDLIRGLSPKPGAFTTFKGKRLGVGRASASDGPASGEPGRIDLTEGLRVSTGDGWLELLEVQPEGKRSMAIDDFVRGYRPDPATRLGL